MKKILFATTALVASTGFAAAQEMAVSGFAEMGIFGGDDIDTQFHTDVDVTFTGVGETDGGLTFGFDVDLDEEIGDNNAVTGGPESGATRDDSDDGGATIFVSGAFGTLTMGDTDGALDWALTEAIIGSSLRDDHEHAGYNGNAGLDGIYDGQVARYDYAFGDFAFAASAEVPDDEDLGDPVLGLGARYAGDFSGIGFSAGLGYQTVENDFDDADIWGVSLAGEFYEGFEAIVNYSTLDSSVLDGDVDHTGLALGYTAGAITVAANWGQFDFEDDTEASGWGLVANYDLGGGAELQAGYGNSEFDGFGVADDDDFSTYSFGIAMAF
ncbi:porin [Tranquillimonas alkanivorans]|uniref:Outer membrane protein OmpU n=1 Tax=Tranquillimonas alkanivorans TaxID=441119 RepID=A0A1I5W7G0_9RHOB|nr:porin [Tranquillimonas alkanivorans]SFQ15593.1 outer membrane protein OmpU [Tranquillimonas alkanivorans]